MVTKIINLIFKVLSPLLLHYLPLPLPPPSSSFLSPTPFLPPLGFPPSDIARLPTPEVPAASMSWIWRRESVVDSWSLVSRGSHSKGEREGHSLHNAYM